MTTRLLQNFLTFFTIMNASICLASDDINPPDNESSIAEGNDDVDTPEESESVDDTTANAVKDPASSVTNVPTSPSLTTNTIAAAPNNAPNNQVGAAPQNIAPNALSNQVASQNNPTNEYAALPILPAQPSGGVSIHNNPVNEVPAPVDPIKASEKEIANSSKQDLKDAEQELGQELQSVEKQAAKALENKIGGIGDFVGKFLGN